MTAPVIASSTPSRFENLFCSAFDPAPSETPERSIISLFALAADRAGLVYPTKEAIADQLIEGLDPANLRRVKPLVNRFFGNQDYFVRARFHEGSVERKGWTGDVTWDEGARLAINGRSRYGTLMINRDIWLDGIEVFYGLDVAGMTRRKKRFSDLFIDRISVTNQARLVVPHLRHHGFPTVNVTELLNRTGLGRSLLEPVPVGRVFTTYRRSEEISRSTGEPRGNVEESFGKRFLKSLMASWIRQDSSGLRQIIDDWFRGSSPWIRRPLETLDDLQVIIDSTPPPNHERGGRTNLHLDWRSFIETIKSGKFLKFDFAGIEGDSYADFPDLPADLLIPNADGSFDLHWSYSPKDKKTSLRLTNIQVNAMLPSPISLQGDVEIVLKYPDHAEIFFDNLEVAVGGLRLPRFGLLRTSGRLNSHIQVDLSGDKPVFQRSWVEIDELVIESEDGGPIQYQVGETTIGGLVDDGDVSFDYDPDRVQERMREGIEIRGIAFSHGPKNRLDLSDLIVRVSSPLNLVALRAEAEGNLTVRSEGGSPYEVRGLKATLRGVAPTADRGPRLLVNLEAGAVPFLQRELTFDSGGEFWAEHFENSCRMKWNGHLALKNQLDASSLVRLGSALFGSSDFETVRLKFLPDFEQIFSDWRFQAATRGEIRFKPEGITEIVDSLKRDSSFRTVQRPAIVKKGDRKVIEGLQCQWKGGEKEGALRCRAEKVGSRVKMKKAELLFPWKREGFQMLFDAATLDDRFGIRGHADQRGRWSLERGVIRPEGGPVRLTNGNIAISLGDRSLDLARGLDLVLTEPGRFRRGQFVTGTIGGLCLSGLLNPRAVGLLGGGVELVQEDGKWLHLKRCGRRLPLRREALVGGK